MGRKEFLIISIQLKRSSKGMTSKEVIASTKGYYRKSVDELTSILKKEN